MDVFCEYLWEIWPRYNDTALWFKDRATTDKYKFKVWSSGKLQRLDAMTEYEGRISTPWSPMSLVLKLAPMYHSFHWSSISLVPQLTVSKTHCSPISIIPHLIAPPPPPPPPPTTPPPPPPPPPPPHHHHHHHHHHPTHTHQHTHIHTMYPWLRSYRWFLWSSKSFTLSQPANHLFIKINLLRNICTKSSHACCNLCR